jgi:hypothetical protein
MKCYHICKLLLPHLPHAFPSVSAFRVGSCYTYWLAVIKWRKSVELLTGIETKLQWHCFLYNLSLIIPLRLLTCWCQYQRIPFIIFIVAYQLFSLDSKGRNIRLSLGRLYDLWNNHFSIFGELFCPPTNFLPQVSLWEKNIWTSDRGRSRMLVCAPPPPTHTHTHTQKSLSSRSLASSGSEVFNFPIVTSLANDSIWFLICKKLC